MNEPALQEYAQNLLALHGYHYRWHDEACCWIVYKLISPLHSFVMGTENSVVEWVAALDWYDRDLESQKRRTDASCKLYPQIKGFKNPL